MQPVIVRDVVWDILKFPIWWYSSGLVWLGRFCRDTLQSYARFFAVSVWMKNIFVPMFGQNDWQSRLISLFMRSVQIVARSFGLMIIAIGLVLFAGVYIAAPILVMLYAAYHIFGSLLYVS